MNVAVTTSCQLPVLGSCEPGTEMHRGMVLTPPELANIGVAEMAAVIPELDEAAGPAATAVDFPDDGFNGEQSEA